MSLEKSIKKLTQVIQARKYAGDLGPLAPPPRLPPLPLEPEPFDPLARESEPFGPPAPEPEIFGPPAPEPPFRPLPPDPPNGWGCYWARERMKKDPNMMSDNCYDTLTPIPYTRIEYYRDTPGGPIKTRERRYD